MSDTGEHAFLRIVSKIIEDNTMSKHYASFDTPRVLIGTFTLERRVHANCQLSYSLLCLKDHQSLNYKMSTGIELWFAPATLLTVALPPKEALLPY